jgi:hypothetical protein
MSLQEMNIKRQAQSLERNLLGIIHFLEDTYDNFQQLCRVFNPKRGYAPTTAKDIKEIYKTANAKIAEARSLQQVLRGKYKAYVQVGAQQQRAVEEFSLMYRKDYRFFEQNQSQWQREQRIAKEKAVPSRLLSHLYALYQKSLSFPSIILCFQGDVSALKELQERFSLGERDIYEIVGDEIWLLLAGIKLPEDSILRSKLTETFVHGVHGRVKGVALKLTTGKEVREDILRGMRRSLAEIKDGEINIL